MNETCCHPVHPVCCSRLWSSLSAMPAGTVPSAAFAFGSCFVRCEEAWLRALRVLGGYSDTTGPTDVTRMRRQD